MRWERIAIVVAAALLIVGCAPQRSATPTTPDTRHSPTAPSRSTKPAEPPWPTTVAQAVDRLVAGLSEDDRAAIRTMKKEDLISLHLGLGMWIRNNFGLWGGNEQLMRSTGQTHPDGASQVIIEALWERLQTSRGSR